jgi:cell fate (sporulation/competence/biofilm development) regulator YlbF (YheA/YmcA/DUF963 family)
MKITADILQEALRRHLSKAGSVKSEKKTLACRANAKKRWDDFREKREKKAFHQRLDETKYQSNKE